MTSAPEESPVRDNPERRRYETEIDGKIAMIVYRLHGDTITFTHTEVPPEFEGQGIAADERSLTIRLEYRSDERTLVEDEVEAIHKQIVERIERELAVKQRV